MTYDFFAGQQDKIDLLNFIFKKSDLQVFDHYSAPGERIIEYKSTNDITSKFDLENGNPFAVAFQLWAPSFKAKPIFNKVNLNPKHCNGYTFRYSTNGWGLIQLYLGGLQRYPGEQHPTLNHSHIGHFNEKGALGRDDDGHLNGIATQWDWKAVEQSSRQLKYLLHQKLSVNKQATSGVLKGAAELEKRGVILR